MFFFLLLPYIYICMNINPAKKGGKKRVGERGNKNSVHQTDFSWFTTDNYHSSCMTGLLLWESRAGEALLVQYPSSSAVLSTCKIPTHLHQEWHCQDQTEGWVRKMDGGSWTEAAGRVGFAHNLTGLEASSVSSTFLLNLIVMALFFKVCFCCCCCCFLKH